MKYYETKLGSLYKGNCNDILPTSPESHFTCIITDPPYELGFMGKKWDSSGVAFQVGTWKEALRVVKPGAFLLAFGGTRTHHRLMCAIEDAGWEIRDCMMWLYGSGFPKSLDISKAIDKAAGVEREVVQEGKAVKRMIPGADQDKTGSWIKDNGREFVPTITEPATPEAQEWNGYGTALKPAWEPIIVAMKPLNSTFANNALNHGVAGLNVDAGRIETIETLIGGAGGLLSNVRDSKSYPKDNRYTPSTQGRFPANIILTHHPECECTGTKKVKGSGTSKTFHEGYNGKSNTKFLRGVSHPGNQHADKDGTETVENWNCRPDCPVGILDEQSGELKSGKMMPTITSGKRNIYQNAGEHQTMETYGDRGSAARFFYCAKASRSERGKDNKHPTVKPKALIKYLIELVAPPKTL